MSIRRAAGSDAGPPDLSAVVVNFNSADYAVGCVRSLLESGFTVEGRPGVLEITVIDNASRGNDLSTLRALEGQRVRIIANLWNVGYAIANNQGFHVSRGRYHLVINPDTRVLPGCLSMLVSHLESHDDVAAVGPAAFMDEDLEVHLPPNELPDPWIQTVQGLAQVSAPAARFNNVRRTAFAYRYWTAREPLEMEMLSGGCFLARREDLLRIGCFDPGFPLYYEDTDLFRRLRGAAGKLVHLPGARMLHFFSRSAITHMKGALHRLGISERRYFRKHFGERGARLHERLAAIAARAKDGVAPPDDPWPMTELPESALAPWLEAPSDEPYYVEIAGNPLFTLAAAAFPEGVGPFRFGPAFWDQLGPAVYWVRFVGKATLLPQRTWRVTKCPRGREEAR
jgi:hypothetical protein